MSRNIIGPKISTNGLVGYWDSQSLRSYAGEPTTNLISSSGIDFSIISSYINLISTIITDNESPSGYSLQMQPEAGFIGSARIRLGVDTDIPTSGFCYISIYAKTIGGSANIIPRVYTGHNWYSMAPLDGGGIYLTNEYRRFGVYAEMGINSQGPNPGFSMTHSETATVNDVTRWHSPQVELKEHATDFIDGIRPSVDGWKDLSGKENHGDLSLCGFDEDGILFDTLGQYVEIPATDEGQLNIKENLTLMCWFKPDTVSGTQTLIRKRLANEEIYRIGLGGNRIQWQTWGSGMSAYTITASAGDIVTGQWNHGAIVLETTSSTSHNVYFYLNGELVDTNSFTGTISTPSSTYPLVIGGGVNGSNNPIHQFYGRIDLAQVYKIPLTDSQVQMNYLAQRSRYF